uniref:type IV secretory system conjugative DNA transfer family protein n=1 Tax=Bacillus multifaciens TaxID=3068506 RepID=UPI003F499DCC
MTLLGITKNIQVIKEAIKEDEAKNTIVVGGMDSGKDYSFIVPNILLEESKSLVVIDYWNEIENIFSYKEAQGYQILQYDITKEGVFQALQNDLKSKQGEKVLIHVIANENKGLDIGDKVYQLLEETKNVQWKDGLHIILKEYGSYQFPELVNMLEVCNAYGISITISVHSALHILPSLQDNCHYILFKGNHNEKESEWISKRVVVFWGNIDGKEMPIPLHPELVRNIRRDYGLLLKCNSNEPARFVETFDTNEIMGREGTQRLEDYIQKGVNEPIKSNK